MFLRLGALIQLFVVLFVAFIIQGCVSNDFGKNADEQQHVEDNGQKLNDQKPQHKDGRMVADGHKEKADDRHHLEDNCQAPVYQEPQEEDGIMATDDHGEKIRKILERDIEFAPIKEVYDFKINSDLYIEAAANQLFVRYYRKTTEATLEEVFAVAEKYGAVVIGNRVDLRLIQFHAANVDLVNLKNDLNKISTIDAYLNMTSYEEE